MYSEKNPGVISESYKWITRVSETLSEAKKVLENGHGKDENHHSRWLPPLQHRGGIRRREAALDSGILEVSVYERAENAGE